MPTAHEDRSNVSTEEVILGRLRRFGTVAACDLCAALRYRLPTRQDVYAVLQAMVAAGQLVEGRRNGGRVYSLPPDAHAGER